MKVLFVLVPCFVSVLSYAGCLDFPKPDDRSDLFQGKTVREFFEPRLQDQVCQSELQQREAKLRSLDEELQKMVASGASPGSIENKERAMESFRMEFLTTLERCGPCASVPVSKKIVPLPGRDEVCYVSDGSCWIPEKAGAYDRARDTMLKLKNYRKRDGGFRSILEFVGVNPQTGDYFPDQVGFDEKNPYIYAGLRGFDFGRVVAFWHVFKAEITESMDDTGRRSIVLKFSGVKPPSQFWPADIHDVTRAGRKRLAVKSSVQGASAQWYLRSDGYVRYWNAADFGLEVSFIEKTGRKMLLDSVYQLSEMFN